MNFPFALFLILALATTAAYAQGHGGRGPGPGGGPGGRNGANPPGSFPSGIGYPSGSRPPADSTPAGNSVPRGTLQLGPSSRWWDDSAYAHSIGLTQTQQRRMDQIFEDNRPALVRLLTNVKQAEAQLEQARRAGNLEENTLFPQIDRVAQARGELAKANAHMLLQIRREMTPAQALRLDEHSQN